MILETVDMEEFETTDWEAFSRMEQASIIEALLSLECMRDSGIRETIIQHDELEEECKVHDYTDEEVYSKYMAHNEQMGTPINLLEYLSEKRESEYYENQIDDDWTSWWKRYDESLTRHALELLKEYESKNK